MKGLVVASVTAVIVAQRNVVNALVQEMAGHSLSNRRWMNGQEIAAPDSVEFEVIEKKLMKKFSHPIRN